MKYKVGDKVVVKSLDWYNENKDEFGNVVFSSKVPHFSWRVNIRTVFTKDMVKFCGKVVTIESVWTVNYSIVEGTYRWYFTDEMIEGLAEEETKPKFKKGDCVKCSDGSIGIIVTCDWADSLNCYQYYIDYIGTLDAGYQQEKDLQPHSITTMNGRDIFEGAKWKHEFECPDGYIFKNENGNVINATKIVLEKKGKEYPKTYQECCKVLHCAYEQGITMRGVTEKEEELFRRLIVLKRCRDAYWKIAGEEMGLGKPWEPEGENTFGIFYDRLTGEIEKQNGYHGANSTLEFPTPEMRDAFKENFDPDIEFCKELL